MNTDAFLKQLATVEEKNTWELFPDATSRVIVGEAEEVELFVSKGRFSEGYQWSMTYLGQVVKTGQLAATREEAKRLAISFSREWANERVTA